MPGAAKAQLVPSHNFEELCATGFWFCRACRKIVTEINTEELVMKCPHCGAHKLKFCPPVQPA
jgi:rubrerythrin